MTLVTRRSTSYELVLLIREGCLDYHGFPPYLYIETSIDGQINSLDWTDIVKMHKGRAVWNKKIVKYFKDIEPATPITISMSMYKKRFIQHGFKLLGTVHFATSDLIPILNKGMAQGRTRLIMRKNQITTSGSIFLGLQLQTINSLPHAPLQRAVSTPAVSSGTKILDITTSFQKPVPIAASVNYDRRTAEETIVAMGSVWTLVIVAMLIFFGSSMMLLA